MVEGAGSAALLVTIYHIYISQNLESEFLLDAFLGHYSEPTTVWEVSDSSIVSDEIQKINYRY
jgi:hypothetical protein